MPLDGAGSGGGSGGEPEEITTEEVMLALGEGFKTLSTRHPNKTLAGWTTVEALARCLGITIRTNALPGHEPTVMKGALAAIAQAYSRDPAELFISGAGER